MEDLDVLILNAKKGDKNSMEEILKLFKPMIIKNCREIFVRNYDIEDLIQIGNISVMNAVHKYKFSNVPFSAYVAKAIKNNFNYLIRKESKQRFTLSLNESIDEDIEAIDVIPSDQNIEELILDCEDKSILFKILSKLSTEEKDLIRNIFFNNCNVKDYAEIKKVKYTTMCKRKRALLKKLNALYSKL